MSVEMHAASAESRVSRPAVASETQLVAGRAKADLPWPTWPRR